MTEECEATTNPLLIHSCSRASLKMRLASLGAAFPHYGEVIYGASGANMPMDLMTVREHIESRKYGNECAGFCRDMRKIWRCCKIYNQVSE